MGIAWNGHTWTTVGKHGDRSIGDRSTQSPPVRSPRGFCNRRRTACLLVAAGVAIVLAALAFFLFYQPPPMLDEAQNTELQMKGFEIAVRQYWREYTQLPHGSTSNVLDVLAARNTDGQNPKRLVFLGFRPPIVRGGRVIFRGDIDDQGNYLDGWGRAFVINLDPKRQHVAIRSPGLNGIDEGGKGDDHYRFIALYID